MSARNFVSKLYTVQSLPIVGQELRSLPSSCFLHKNLSNKTMLTCPLESLFGNFQLRIRNLSARNFVSKLYTVQSLPIVGQELRYLPRPCFLHKTKSKTMLLICLPETLFRNSTLCNLCPKLGMSYDIYQGHFSTHEHIK
jgi:hypothetical protein